MITTEQLEDLIHNMESDRIEKTIATRDYDKFAEAACAFAVIIHKRPNV